MPLSGSIGIIAGLTMTFAGLAVFVVAHLGGLGRLPRQHWAGIRVPSTLKSDPAWRAAHLAAAPAMRLSGLGALAGGLGAAICAMIEADSAIIWFMLGGILCLLAGLVVGGREGRPGGARYAVITVRRWHTEAG